MQHNSLAMDTIPDPALVKMLLAEDCWHPLHLGDGEGEYSSENTAYLEEHIFPTLIPAIHRLLEHVQLRFSQSQILNASYPENERKSDQMARDVQNPYARPPRRIPSSRCISTLHPTGGPNAIEWIAQYLLRYNPRPKGIRRSDAIDSDSYNNNNIPVVSRDGFPKSVQRLTLSVRNQLPGVRLQEYHPYCVLYRQQRSVQKAAGLIEAIERTAAQADTTDEASIHAQGSAMSAALYLKSS